MRTQLTILTLGIGLACGSVNAQASSESSLAKAVSGSKVNASLRYRLETVDQDGIAEDAAANTVKGRITVKTGQVSNWNAVVEFDYVGELFNKDYNDTINGKTNYPVVADPSGSDLNQAFLQYTASKDTNVRFGRQRINHNNQRFVGGVAWRQNEQTFDGIRIQSKFGNGVSIDYSYAYNVNRIFGSRSPGGDQNTNLHMFNAAYSPAKGHKLAVFGYHMDFDDALALSNQTFGVDYNFKTKVGGVGYGFHASYASQSDAADSPFDYSTDYFAIDGSVKFSGVTLSAGYEVLGSDNGRGFITPLATLHKFNGWTDKFLGTPGTGLEDVWFKAATKVGEVALAAVYHQFDAEEGSADYGNELGLVANYQPSKNYTITAKYATYDAETHASDTDKFWLQILAKY